MSKIDFFSPRNKQSFYSLTFSLSLSLSLSLSIFHSFASLFRFAQDV